MILRHDLITNWRTAQIFAQLPRTRRIIDVGPGIRPCPAFPCDEHICVEPCEEYRSHLEEWRPIDRKVIIAPYEACDIADIFERSDTTILALDVIEHMERDVGLRCLHIFEAFEHAVVFTPLGWYEQGGENPDAWGLSGGDWQKHRSAWYPDDFDEWKWTTHTWRWFHKKKRVGAILAVR